MSTKQPQPQVNNSFKDSRQVGMGGMVTVTDQHDIKDVESPDMLNTWFDAGIIGVRTGSQIFATKPTGETGTPLQCMVAKTSDGVSYLISVYSSGTATNNFYLWDVKNSWWVPINGSYLPTFTQVKRFGYQGWCGGFGDDRLYFCNGYDHVARWRMNLDYLAVTTQPSDTSLTLNDASRFSIYTATISATLIADNVVTLNASPQQNAIYTNQWELGQMVYYVGSGVSGLTTNTLYYAVPTAYSLPTNGTSGNNLGFATSLANAIAGNVVSISGTPSGTNTIYKAEPIILQSAVGSTTNAIYYNKTGNVLTLTATIGASVAASSSVTTTITDRPMVQGNLSIHGKIFTTWQARLVMANQSLGAESTMYVSRVSQPEDWTTIGDDISSGGNQIFQDGFGAITDLKEFGAFLVVQKQDISYRFSFATNADLSAQFPQVTPIISGLGMGAINNQASVKAMNSIYYPTTTSGFINLSPVSSGTSNSTGVQVISYPINNYVQNSLDFTNSVGTFFRNKLLWTADSSSGSSVVMVYDTVRNAWTRFDSWNPKDIFVYNNLLYFISKFDGNVYQGFTGYTDNSNPYYAYVYSKMNNYGQPSLVKVADAIYVEGYMTQSTTIYADVLYNERGELFFETFKLAYGQNGFYFTNVNITGLDQVPINQGILDSLTPSQIKQLGFFRGYLSIDNSHGFFALQIKFYSKDADSVWFIIGQGANVEYQPQIPPLMRIDNTSVSGGIQHDFWILDADIATLTNPVDGVNTTFILPPSTQVVVYADGLRMTESVDYNLTNDHTIVFINNAQPHDTISVDYLPKQNTGTAPKNHWTLGATPTGAVDGVNTVFTFPASFQVVVYADGLRMDELVDYDLTDDHTVTFINNAQPHSAITVDYLPK
jgi:hypothetical protein